MVRQFFMQVKVNQVLCSHLLRVSKSSQNCHANVNCQNRLKFVHENLLVQEDWGPISTQSLRHERLLGHRLEIVIKFVFIELSEENLR